MKTETKYKLIVGHIQYVDLESGYWELAEDDHKYRISNTPDQLKHENSRIAAMVEVIENEMSIFMSGNSIKIIDYKIIK